MKYMTSILAIITVGAFLTGCATAPALKDARVEPPVLRPAQPGVLSVKVQDRYQIVKSVVATLKSGDQVMDIKLKDDGQPPDVKADDGLWTVGVSVPLTALPGQYKMTISACDSKGKPLMVSGETGSVPLETAVNATVEVPGMQAPTHPASADPAADTDTDTPPAAPGTPQ